MFCSVGLHKHLIKLFDIKYSSVEIITLKFMCIVVSKDEAFADFNIIVKT